jgi:hypothetical protein
MGFVLCLIFVPNSDRIYTQSPQFSLQCSHQPRYALSNLHHGKRYRPVQRHFILLVTVSSCYFLIECKDTEEWSNNIVKQPNSVEIFSDVICRNCVSYNQSHCCKALPAIPTNPDNKCSEGNWFFEGNIINFRQICLELLPINFVTDVEDLFCKNCIYYDSSKKECHFHRQHVYKTASDDWCDNGGWIHRDNDKDGNPVSSSLFTERFEDTDKK